MRYVCLLAALAAWAPAAQAQYAVSSGYAAGYYQYPVAQKVVASNIAVAPLIVSVPVDSKAVPAAAYGAPYYYTVNEAFTAKAAIRDVIREELRNYVQAQPPAAVKAPPPAAAPPADQPPPPPAPADGLQPPAVPPAEPPAGAAAVRSEPPAHDDVAPMELQEKVLAALGGVGNCLNCHGPSGSQKLKFVDAEGQLLKLSSDKRWKIYGMASAGAMPPSAAKDKTKAVAASDLPALLRWAAVK